MLADVPVTPTVAPTSDDSITTTNKVKIDIHSIDVADNGGSPITSYSLEVDDAHGGDFIPVFGLLTNSLATSYIFT